MKKAPPIDRLIEVLQIAKKYKPNDYVIQCAREEMYLMLNPSHISKEDNERLNELGFKTDYNIYVSSEFGSC